ncbi:M16 family metallopeptidase [Pelomonas aquatica]|uniref:Insulinase family protein n=1 Tax=Pelomonas aquatica TaxID=431058 RepID=A0A9X4R5J2_9BURK|nr:pitrilysin family protein [Pelomonas aquatica]MCY4752826.1 pitrilysin family protein [Pelomonas aquatica]MDG0864477.1 insulinase family protein [Pelomonas aquatica]
MRLLPRHAALLLALPLLAAAAPTAAPLAPVREAEGVREYRLPNGLQVLLIPDATKPTVTVNVTYRVGSRHEGNGETGMAHLLEHLMFKTTQRFANVGAELSKRGMQFNGTTNADRTNYFETFPADPAQLGWALAMEADRMTGAKVLRSDLDTEMTVVRNEMEAGENNALNILVQRTQAAAYQWHPYGRSTIGARSDVEHVAIPSLQAFYKRNYQPDNATLVVAGAFDPQRTLAEVQRLFGALPRPTRVLPPTYTVEPVQEGERLVTLRRPSGMQGVLASYHVPPLASPDFAAFEVAVTALADTPSGRLHKRAVEPGLAAQAFGWPGRNTEPGLLNLGLVLKSDNDVDRAQQLLVDTVESLAKEPITAEELQRAQAQWAKNFDELMANPQNLCVALSEAIAAGDWRLLFQLRNRVESTTVDGVNTTLRQWLLPSNRTLGRLYATAAPERSPLALPIAAADALKDFVPKAALAAGEAFDTSPANFDRRTERYQLANGLRVALVPKRSRGETVELALNLHYGNVDSLRGKRPEAALVGEALALGSRQHTRAQIADGFDKLKTRFSAGSSPTGDAHVSLSSHRPQLQQALALMAEVLREPSFPAAEVEQAVRQQVARIEEAAQQPQAVASHALEQALSAAYPADDPRHRGSFAEGIAALKALTPERLQAFHREFWGAAHGELVLVGDFDAAEVKPQIERLFGGLSAAQAYVRVPQPLPAVQGLKLSETLKDKANAMVFGALLLPVNDDHPDYAALRIAAHVLGASGFDSRLLTRLRQKEGVSYGAGAWLNASSFEPNARLGMAAIFAPENRGRVEAALNDELARFVREGITQAELDTAKRAMKAQSDTWRSDDGAVAGAIAGHLERARQFKWNAELDARGEALTLAEVNAAIKRWIDPTKANWSWAGDFDKPQAAK